MFRSRQIAFVLLLFMGGAPVAFAADLSTLIPADVKAAVIVRDTAKLEEDVKAYASKLNLPIPVDVIEFDQILVMSGLNGALGKQAGVVVTDASMSGVTVVIEFDNINEVLESPGIEKTDEADVYSIDVMEMSGMALIVDKIAFVQFDVEDAKGLERFRKVDKSLASILTSSQQKMLESNDLFFTVDVQQWREIATQGLDSIEEQMKAGFEQALGDDDAKEDDDENEEDPGEDDDDDEEDAEDEAADDDDEEMERDAGQADLAQQAMTAMKAYVDIARLLLRDTNHVFGGVDVMEENVNIRLAAHVVPESQLAKMFPAGGRATTDFFQGLPDRSFLVAGGADAKTLQPLFLELTKWGASLVNKELDVEDRKAIAESMAVMEKAELATGLMSMGAEGGMVMLGQYKSDDPAAMLEMQKNQFHTSQDVLKRLYGMVFSGEVKDRKVDGRDVVEVEMNLSEMFEGVLAGQADVPGAPKPDDLVKMIYGTENGKFIMQMDIVGDFLRYAASGKPDPIKMFDSSKRIQIALAKLPKESSAAGVLDIMDYLGMMSRMFKAMDLPFPMPEPDLENPTTPISAALVTRKDEPSIEVVLPADHIAALVKVFVGMAQGFGVEAPAADQGEPPPQF